jgi:hypothetical protein
VVAARKSFASRAGSVSLRLEPANEPKHTRAHSLLSGKHEPLLVRSSSALAATYLPACLPTSSTVRAAVSQRTTSAPQRSGAAAVTTYLPTYPWATSGSAPKQASPCPSASGVSGWCIQPECGPSTHNRSDALTCDAALERRRCAAAAVSLCNMQHTACKARITTQACSDPRRGETCNVCTTCSTHEMRARGAVPYAAVCVWGWQRQRSQVKAQPPT